MKKIMRTPLEEQISDFIMQRTLILSNSHAEFVRNARLFLNMIKDTPPFNTDGELLRVLRGGSDYDKARLISYMSHLQATGRYQPYTSFELSKENTRAPQPIENIEVASNSTLKGEAQIAQHHADQAEFQSTCREKDLIAHRDTRGNGSCYYNAVMQAHIEQLIVSGNSNREILFNHLATMIERNVLGGSLFQERGTENDKARMERLVEKLREAALGGAWNTLQEFRYDLVNTTEDGDDHTLVQASRFLTAQYCVDYKDYAGEQGDDLALNYLFGLEKGDFERGIHNILEKDIEAEFHPDKQILPQLIGCQASMMQMHQTGGHNYQEASALNLHPSRRPPVQHTEICIFYTPGHYGYLHTREQYAAIQDKENSDQRSNPIRFNVEAVAEDNDFDNPFFDTMRILDINEPTVLFTMGQELIDTFLQTSINKLEEGLTNAHMDEDQVKHWITQFRVWAIQSNNYKNKLGVLDAYEHRKFAPKASVALENPFELIKIQCEEDPGNFRARNDPAIDTALEHAFETIRNQLTSYPKQAAQIKDLVEDFNRWAQQGLSANSKINSRLERINGFLGDNNLFAVEANNERLHKIKAHENISSSRQNSRDTEERRMAPKAVKMPPKSSVQLAAEAEEAMNRAFSAILPPFTEIKFLYDDEALKQGWTGPELFRVQFPNQRITKIAQKINQYKQDFPSKINEINGWVEEFSKWANQGLKRGQSCEQIENFHKELANTAPICRKYKERHAELCTSPIEAPSSKKDNKAPKNSGPSIA